MEPRTRALPLCSHLKFPSSKFIDDFYRCQRVSWPLARYGGIVSECLCTSPSWTGASESMSSMKQWSWLAAGFCSRVDEHELITTATGAEWSSKWHPGMRWKPFSGFEMHNALWQPVVKQKQIIKGHKSKWCALVLILLHRKYSPI